MDSLSADHRNDISLGVVGSMVMEFIIARNTGSKGYFLLAGFRNYGSE
ncbi:hypothetical protein BD94_3852 [Elizabethkingia anophelis NUHP1]|uniref:Uncharacterized protein n=1 Tax=Elizabethkingia anophelis NUHP1 TaxID=1338011 RepID=A0A077EJL1_9FLAO|nr:hypothetical protein BD94_3852 [Elizabethkingia anophelis NUHP1]